MRDRRPLSRPGEAPPAAEDVPRLLRKLAAPAGAGGGAASRALGQGDAALAALLEEIDETVMARRLLLSNAEGAEMALDVCNRRLLRAGAVEGGGPEALAAETLTYAGIEDLAALRARLTRFCAAGDARLRTSRARDGATLEQTGVAVATLRQAWALPAAPGATPGCGGQGVPALCEALADLALASALVRHDERPSLHGAPALADRLATLLPETHARLSGPGPQALVLVGEARDAPALLLLRDDTACAVLAVAPDAVAQTIARWREAGPE